MSGDVSLTILIDNGYRLGAKTMVRVSTEAAPRRDVDRLLYDGYRLLVLVCVFILSTVLLLSSTVVAFLSRTVGHFSSTSPSASQAPDDQRSRAYVRFPSLQELKDMADTLPRIHITDPQLTTSNAPQSATPFTPNDFADAVEFQAPPSRHATNDSSLSSPTRAGDATGRRSLARDDAKSGSAERPLSSGSFDPVSQEIYERTGSSPGPGTSQRAQQKSDNRSNTLNILNGDAGEPRPSSDMSRFDPSHRASKDKKKGVTFLSRIIGNKKREEQDEASINSSDMGDERPEGADIELFSQSFENMGFAPKHRPPPPYVKMRSKYKREREFNRLFLSQQLRDYSTTYQMDTASISSSQTTLRKGQEPGGKAVWALEVSKDGKYLATAGQDHLVRIWSILSSQQDRAQFSKDEESHMEQGQSHLSAPVFKDQPLRTFTGHTGDVLSLSWSKNNFLLSSSMDKTVRLWHASRSECLCAFKHGDFVTSVAFHPKDDRFFLAGSLDSKLRLWSIPDKAVAYWNQAPDMITSVAFTPDGKQAMAGTLSGYCLFYETESLRYQTQLHVKSRTGKNAKGSKITGIKAMHIPPVGTNHSTNSLHKLTDVKILITSNDSRLRMYNLRDKSLEMKFKGHENMSSQIHARFSDDGRYVISGSEDKKVYIWSTSTSDTIEASNSRKDHWPVEIFEAHNANTTCAAFLPQRSRQHLSASADPIYDVCNPPPVTLVSRSEAADVSFTSVRHSISVDIPSANDTAPTVRPSIDSRRASETSTAGYLNRTAHQNGNVIIAASGTGLISVFRQDCAWRNRARSNADPSAYTHASDTSSIKRVGSNLVHRSSMSIARGGPGNLSRQNSTTSNRSSIGPGGLRHSSYGSLQGPPANPQGRERIQTWRQSISGSSVHSIDRERPSVNVTGSSSSSPALPQMRAGTRSTSPLKGFTKRASQLVPGTRSPAPSSPTKAGAPSTPLLDGPNDLKQQPSSGSLQTTPLEQKRLSGSGLLNRPADVQRGDSYFREDAFYDEAKRQLVAPPRSIKATSSSASRNTSVSPSRSQSLRPVNQRSGVSSGTGSNAGSLPELEQKLTAFSELSDAESNSGRR